jgi:prepilin-type N-terminal cleavage/methylation domain-containing protein/prepilin-type processing-associated H-X9-DG protein
MSRKRDGRPLLVARGTAGFSLVELLVVIAIIGVLLAVLLPAIQAARESSRAASCKNNLRQMSMAMHLYHDSAKRLPPARIETAFTGGQAGPFFIVLPFLEEDAVASRFDKKNSYQVGADNRTVVNTRIPTYLCPTMNLPREVPDPGGLCDETGAPGSYAVSTGSTISFGPVAAGFNLPAHNGAIIHPMYGATTIPKISNADGSSQTFLIGEMNYGLTDLVWPCPAGAGKNRMGQTRWAVAYPGVTWASTAGRLNRDKQDTLISPIFYAENESFKSDHPGGVHFAMVDGSVRYIADVIEQSILQALTTRDGGEKVDRID